LRTRLVEDACVYVLFPKGTRTRDGWMGAFKPGLGMLVADTAVPIVPCHIRGAFQALSPGRHLPRPASITLRIGEPQTFQNISNCRKEWPQIAREMHKRDSTLGTTPPPASESTSPPG